MRAMSIASIREWALRGIHSKTLGNTVLVGSAAVANGIVGALSSAVYARVLGVDGFGTLAVIISLMTMLVALADLGISGSLVRFGSQAVAAGDRALFRRVLSESVRAKLVLAAAILCLAMVFLNPIVSYVLKGVDEEITSYFRLSLVAVAVSMAASIFPPVFQSFRLFRTQAVLSVLPGALKLAIVLTLAAAIAHVTVQLGVWIEIITAVVLLLLSFSFSPERRLWQAEGDRTLRRQMFAFNKWLSLSYIVTLIGGRLDLFFVGGLTDARALGLYVAASKVASMVVVITNSYLTVLLPDLSGALDAAALRRKQKLSFAVVGLFSLGIVLLAVLAVPITRVIFGAAFGESAFLLQIMCIGLLCTVLAYPTNATMFALNRSVVFPASALCAVLTIAAGNAWLVPMWGARGAAVAFSCSGVVSLAVSLALYFSLRPRSGRDRGIGS